MHKIEVYGTIAADPTLAVTYRLPGSWQECTLAQLATVTALLSLPAEESADPEAADRADAALRLHLFRELCVIPAQVFTQLAVEDLVALRTDKDGLSGAAFLPQLDWCMEAPAFATSVLPTVVLGKVKYQGPTDRLAKFTLLQWGFCDVLLQRLIKSGEEKDLANLLGALYHPASEAWDNEHIERNGKALMDLDDRTKLAAVTNYRGLRGWLAGKYRRCFRGGKADPHGIQGMIVHMAGPKFGTVENTRKANVHDVLVHVEHLLEEQQRLEEQAKRK